MSAANVELVRKLYARLREGGWAGSAASGLLELAEPDCEFDFSSAYIDGPVLRGVTAVRAFTQQGVWEGSIDFEPEEVLEVDSERVLALVRFRATGGSAGVAVEAKVAHVITVGDEGQVTRVKAYADRAEALEAVGLGARGDTRRSGRGS